MNLESCVGCRPNLHMISMICTNQTQLDSMEVMTDYLQTEGGMTVTELEAAKRYFGSLTDPWNIICRVNKRWILGT